MGSVKDLVVKNQAMPDEVGRGIFVFSDRYSVFDWGEMPDSIEDKGKALAVMGAYNFELLEKEGIKTHYEGLLEGDQVKGVAELDEPSREMAIRLAHKPEITFRDGTYHYEGLDGDSYLIPLEIVFRNSVPRGSSLRRRYQPEQLGFSFSQWPEEDLTLESPVVEFSTKFEREDRYLAEEEAWRISGLSEREFEKLRSLAREVNEKLTAHAKERGFEHLDGKIECIYEKGHIVLADVAGTFDENRFSFNGVGISKEFLRQWYKEEDPDWYEAVGEAKQKARQEGLKDWKGLVERGPKRLDRDTLELAESLYRAGTNRWLGRDIFEAPSLEEVTERL